MTDKRPALSPSEAAVKLGVSTKALRLYEQRGLIAPVRTQAGWRVYGPAEMDRVSEIKALRGLGFTLAEVASLLDAGPDALQSALVARQTDIEERIGRLAKTLGDVKRLRSEVLEAGSAGTAPRPGVQLTLPWPWDGELFEVEDRRPLTFITGPLGSGKTRFARTLAKTLPGARFLGLDRLEGDATGPLEVLMAEIDAGQEGALVVDMVEQGLDRATQEALITRLRDRGPGARPLFLMTRSSAILNLARTTPEDAIILCPANHAPPAYVVPVPDAPGYEAVASCLATPDVRARTAGVVVRFAS